jgi:hypothetical protein
MAFAVTTGHKARSAVLASHDPVVYAELQVVEVSRVV